MENKEKLVELLLNIPPVGYGVLMDKEYTASYIADWLIENGVTVKE